MRVGTTCYATDQGLGILAKAFYDNGVITDPILIGHGSRENHYDWYESKTPIINDLRKIPQSIYTTIAGCDAMLFFETPFYWPLIPWCRERGIKTILMTMYECTPKDLPYVPDHFFCPSLLDKQYFQDRPNSFITVPVEATWRQRTKAEVFIHNAGHGGLRGRNGTEELIEATNYIRSDARVIIRSQNAIRQPAINSHVEYRVGTIPYDSLFSEGDVFVFPEKFNGLSLPLQEAYASGLAIMATNRFPMNRWLPIENLVEPSGYQKACISGRCLDFDEAILDPRLIAEKIDWLYGKDISAVSLSGKHWAEANSWQRLKPQYINTIKEVISDLD